MKTSGKYNIINNSSLRQSVFKDITSDGKGTWDMREKDGIGLNDMRKRWG